MSTFRSGHLFAGLMGLSFACAFVVPPPRFTTPVRAQAQGLFAPVSWPTRAVAGVDGSGVREALKITGGAGFVGRPVVHGTGLVGRVVASGVTGAEVRLLTDPGFVFTAGVARYLPDAAGRVSLVRVEGLRPWVSGVGHGAMAIRSAVTVQQVDTLHLAAGDLVVLDDDGWPPNVQGFCAGRVASITRQANAPAFADLCVEPVTDPLRLSEVMVVVKN